MIKRVQKIRFIQDRCKGHDKVTWVIIWMVCNCNLMLLLNLVSTCWSLISAWSSLELFFLSAIILQAVLWTSVQRWLCRNEAWFRHGTYYLASCNCSSLLWYRILVVNFAMTCPHVVDRSTLGGTQNSTFMTTWSKLSRKISREWLV